MYIAFIPSLRFVSFFFAGIRLTLNFGLDCISIGTFLEQVLDGQHTMYAHI